LKDCFNILSNSDLIKKAGFTGLFVTVNNGKTVWKIPENGLTCGSYYVRNIKSKKQ